MSNSDEWDEELYDEGYATGQQWASHSAKRGELRRLSKLYEYAEATDWERRLHCVDDEWEVDSIMVAIDRHLEDDRQGIRERWEQIVGRNDTDVWEPEFTEGFVEGALGIEFAEEQTDVGTRDETTTASEPHSAEAAGLPEDDEFGKAHRHIRFD